MSRRPFVGNVIPPIALEFVGSWKSSVSVWQIVPAAGRVSLTRYAPMARAVHVEKPEKDVCCEGGDQLAILWKQNLNSPRSSSVGE